MIPATLKHSTFPDGVATLAGIAMSIGIPYELD